MMLRSTSTKENIVVEGPNRSMVEEGVSRKGLFSSLVVFVSFTIVAAMVFIAGWLAVGE
jgi:hypothetical protein